MCNPDASSVIQLQIKGQFADVCPFVCERLSFEQTDKSSFHSSTAELEVVRESSESKAFLLVKKPQ